MALGPLYIYKCVEIGGVGGIEIGGKVYESKRLSSEIYEGKQLRL
jgi:hypothetical protein